MKCIYCNNEETKVIETRQAGDDLRRRRECTNCSQRFTTYERVERQPMRIIKKDGSRQLYNRDKLKHGMLIACEKRPVTDDEINGALNEVEKQLRALGEPEIHSKLIGDLTMQQLRLLDQIAYIRFASVYKEFKDVESFAKEIKVLTRGN